jgi:hypothetical protein
MNANPGKMEARIALVLFPFKAYVAMGFPFLILRELVHHVVQPHVYGDPEGALAVVLQGYAISSMILLPGALLQTLNCRWGSALKTCAFFVVGFGMFFLFRFRGQMIG